MDATAAILTLVGFALTSTKTTYETIAGIHDGPRIATEAAESLDSAMSSLRELEHAIPSGMSNDFPQVIKRYRDTLDSYQSKILRIRRLPTDGPLRRSWKRIQTMLQENDLRRLHQAAQEFTSIYIKYKVVEQRELAIESRDKLQKLEITGKAHTTDLKNTNLSIESGLSSHSAEIRQTLSEYSARNTSQSQLILSLLKEMKGDMKKMSLEQCELARGTLEHLSLQNQTSRDDDRSRVDCRATQTDTEDSIARREIQEEIEQLMDSLTSYSHEKEKRLYCDEAEPIIEALDRMFEVLFDTQSRPDKSRKRSISNAFDTNVTCAEAKRIKRTVGSSQQVLLNGKDNGTLCRLTKGYRRSQLFLDGNYRKGKVRMLTQIGRLIQETNSEPAVTSDENAVGILKGTLSILPGKVKEIGILVSFYHKISRNSSESIAPSITFSRTLSSNSEIFSTIENGHLHALKTMLYHREAYLSDRDEKGRCLLNYAIFYAQPEICQFLVDEGAAVDFVEPSLYDDRAFSSSLCIQRYDYSVVCLDDAGERIRPRMSDCQRILLKHGADPLLHPWNWPEDSLWDNTLYCGTIDNLSAICYEGRELLDIRYVNDNKESALHRLLAGGFWTTTTVDLLLEHGAFVDYNTKHGSYLHQAMKGASAATKEDLLGVLCLLLKYGADPYATTRHGITVSDIACCEKANSEVLTHTKALLSGLKLLEIWTLALADAGYDAGEVIGASFDPHYCSRCSTSRRIRCWGDGKTKWRYMNRRTFSRRTRDYWEENTRAGFPRLPKGRCILFEELGSWDDLKELRVYEQAWDAEDSGADDLETEESNLDADDLDRDDLDTNDLDRACTSKGSLGAMNLLVTVMRGQGLNTDSLRSCVSQESSQHSDYEASNSSQECWSSQLEQRQSFHDASISELNTLESESRVWELESLQC